MYVAYRGPGKVGYYFEVKCGNNQSSWAYAKAVVPSLRDVYTTAYEIDAGTTAVATSIGTFILTLLTPVIGDEVASAGSISSAWAAVRNLGLSSNVMAILQSLAFQLGYTLVA